MLSNLFFTLLKMNIMATLVAIIVLSLKFILKKCGASRKLLFYLWIIIALRYVCPDFVKSNFSLFNIFDMNITEETTAIENDNYKIENNFLVDKDTTENNIDKSNDLQSNVFSDSKTDKNFKESEIISLEIKEKFKITNFLMIIWILGSVVFIIYGFISYIKFKKSIMFACRGEGDYYETDMISTPCVVGIVKPKIYLTLNLTKEERKYILVHENTHIKRKDYITKFIAYLILTIHWINPICHILFKMFTNDMEMLCDEESIEKIGNENKNEYMESLVKLSSKGMKNILPCPIAFSENNTEKRVRNMIKYKKSSIIVSIVALILCILFTAICLTNKKDKPNENESLYKQLNVILENKNLWYEDTEDTKYSYAVTDLDKNNRLEIISSICTGTGIYTYTKIYEVNEKNDGLKLCESNISEEDSQADITKNQFTVFYDKSNNEYHYILDDLIKNGAAEYYENKRDFCLNNGKITEKYLAYKTTIYKDSKPEVTYTDFNNKKINEEEYNNYEYEIFKSFKKMVANLEWLRDYNEIKLEDLKYSYDKFLIYKEEAPKLSNKRNEVYKEALKGIYENKVLPDGTELGYNESSDITLNKFAILDIDFDGNKELIVSYTETFTAGMMTIIYDFDEETNTLKDEFLAFPTLDFYSNGVIEAFASHNHGYAGDSLWPYTLYKYNKELDSYDQIAYVDAWNKSNRDKDEFGNVFPDEVDKDKDGVVYYVMMDGKYELKNPIDLAEYNKWRNDYITEETEKIEVPYISLTKENIDNIL